MILGGMAVVLVSAATSQLRDPVFTQMHDVLLLSAHRIDSRSTTTLSGIKQLQNILQHLLEVGLKTSLTFM